MNCQKCLLDFPEREIQESHDVPKYMFGGDKNKADKHGRHWLCKKCHDIYERLVFCIAFNILKEEDKERVRERIKSHASHYFKR